VEYPLKQAQALMDYSRNHLFMFVEDWILAWMAVSDDGTYAPIPGITMIQKQMVVIIREFAPDHDIPSENPEETFRKLASHFTEINAAGGIVENPDGEYLFIFRNGVWDLPKGKQEDGEEISVTAVREVEEECGVRNIELGNLLCITWHTYHRDGKFYLKHTYWYKMSDPVKEELKPQLEEDITSAVWVKKDDVMECLKNTYPSIKEVIGKL
jgi:8-oxo-dGTP pyrophosphatase MutT (NUDIX family)